MAPVVVGDLFAKDLSKPPLLSGGFFVSNVRHFVIPDDVRVFRLTEKTYSGADFQYIADVEILGFHSADFIEQEIDNMRAQGDSDESIIEHIVELDMFDDSLNIPIARFAYNDFNFVDRDGNPALGKQIKGAFVDPEQSGVGLAGFIYLQIVYMYKHLICDNTQTEYGAALWASTMRENIGVVDIYDASRHKFVDELGEKGRGVNGFTPWELHPAATQLKLNRWKVYPFNVQSCYHIVLIISA